MMGYITISEAWFGQFPRWIPTGIKDRAAHTITMSCVSTEFQPNNKDTENINLTIPFHHLPSTPPRKGFNVFQLSVHLWHWAGPPLVWWASLPAQSYSCSTWIHSYFETWSTGKDQKKRSDPSSKLTLKIRSPSINMSYRLYELCLWSCSVIQAHRVFCNQQGYSYNNAHSSPQRGHKPQRYKILSFMIPPVLQHPCCWDMVCFDRCSSAGHSKHGGKMRLELPSTAYRRFVFKVCLSVKYVTKPTLVKLGHDQPIYSWGSTWLVATSFCLSKTARKLFEGR